jgi:RNA polymerase II subunit A-like phosphatase
MCLKCNKDLSHLTQQQQALLGNKVSMLHKDHRFKINQNEGKLIAEEEQKRLLDVEKKLVLVLDIDHTLLHATGDPLAVSAFDIVRKKGVHLNSFCQIEGKDDRYGFTWCHILKLRPYLREFLEEASRICELHIFTHGNRIYADKVAKVLDPTGKLFGERVISRDEMEISSPENSRKTLKHIFPADDRAVMIIDDSIRVWAGHESNLFEIIPYIPWEIYFGISKDVNNRPGSKFPQAQNSQLLPLNLFVNKMIEIDRKEHDNQLKAILDKLHYIHTKFFERDKRGENVHVKDLIVESKGSILKGTNILFSGVIPLGSNPSNERIWRLAERMGANCYIEWSENVSITHLIAKSRDPNNLTEKIRRAEKTPGVFIVHHSWVEQCYRFSDHFNEFDFLLYRSNCSLPSVDFIQLVKQQFMNSKPLQGS